MKKVVPSILALVVVVVLIIFNPLEVVRWKISDLFFKGKPVSPEITIIAIDEKSLDTAGGLGRFKDWPRTYFAQLLRTLKPYTPAVVAFDLDFRESARGISDLRVSQILREYERRATEGSASGFGWYEVMRRFEPDRGEGSSTPQVGLKHPDDVEFQKAMNESGPVVLASLLTFNELVDYEQFGSFVSVIKPIFSGSNIQTGFVNVVLDRDGVLRRFMHFAKDQSAFSVAVANAFMSPGGVSPNEPIIGAKPNAANEIRPLTISYTGKPYSFISIPFIDVLEKRFDPELIKNKIVLIGPTAGILNDLQNTPTSRNPMPGVEIHANMIQQFLEMRVAREQGLFSLILVLIIITVGGGLVFLELPLRIFAVVLGALLLAYPAIGYALYQRDVIINVVYPEIGFVATAIAALWYRNKTELKEKRMIKQAFSHYVSPVIVNELVKKPETLRLGGKREHITVLFSDIVGFTTLSEQLTPEDTVAVLNDYLTAMTEIIFVYHGTLDKYQGDAIMALFGAPLDDPHHAVNACHAALGMRKALVALHEKWNAIPNLPFKEKLVQLDFRVGIASGPAVIGNVGSEKRFDYTAIGDIVNLGSRLESINRKYGTNVIVDKGTFIMITENHNPFIFRKLDVVRVKGKKMETEIFEVFGLLENQTDEMRAVLDDFENGRLMYGERNFLGAKQHFEVVLQRLPSDGPAQIYRNRCDFFIRKPPSRDWSPIVTLEEK